jgi:hypothetical protein
MNYALAMIAVFFVFGCFAKLVNAYYEKQSTHYVLPSHPSTNHNPYSF